MANNDGRVSTYFLSYSRSDEVIALRFANDLIAAGVPVWVDQYDIRPSQHWDRAVEDAVLGCTGLIVMLSPRSAASPNVADEVSVAIERGKAIIPILVEKCNVPLRMTRMQFIDATTDYARALQRCLAEISRKAAASGEESAEPVVDLAVPVAPAPVTAPQLSSTVTDLATRRLTPLVGPIAAVLVRTAAAQATSEAELYEALAGKIPNAAQRDAFLRSVPRAISKAPAAKLALAANAAAPLLAPDEVDRMVVVLTRHLGPIATHVVRREQKVSASADDLYRRLANLLPNERARADFLKQRD